MQISGSNLLIASQLQAGQTPPKRSASFAAALTEPKSAQSEDSFAPLEFKQVVAEPAVQRAQTGSGTASQMPMGSQVDIRV